MFITKYQIKFPSFSRVSPAGCCKLGAFTGYQNFTSSALSATAAIMAHNKGLELGADMVLLLMGGGVLAKK